MVPRLSWLEAGSYNITALAITFNMVRVLHGI